MATSARVASHVPGMDNVVPDVLSTLSEPGHSHGLPSALEHLEIEMPTSPSHSFNQMLHTPAHYDGKGERMLLQGVSQKFGAIGV
eukprot:732083-Amphidinium_carterae.1